MNASIYRQPILNADFAIDGYELFSNQGEDAAASTVYSGQDSTICRTLTNSFCGFSTEALLGGGTAYVGVTYNLIHEGLPNLYKPSVFTIEVAPNLFLDEALADMLTALHHKGYTLALKSYTPTVERSGNLKYLNMFDVVRIDVRKHHRLSVKQFVKMLRKYRVRLLAENVETPEDLAFARELGFDLFQGKVFGEPAVLSRKVSLREMPYGKLFNHLLTGRVNRSLCTRIIREDPAMTHMFLRKVFNSMYNRKAPDLEVERGLSLIGEDKLRHWAAVLLLDQACEAGMDELVPQVYRRGLLTEGLASAANLEVPSGKAFLFGVASALDRVFGESVEEVSSQLALGKSMRGALLFGEKNDFYALLQAADAVEKNSENPLLPPAFSGLGREFLANLLWKCQVNTEYITLSLEYTVPETYKGNILR